MKLKLKTAPAVEPVTLSQVLTQTRLDVTSPELSSGTLTIGTYYLITATATDAFYTGCAIGDTFEATAATSLTSNNKVREIYEGYHLNSLVVAAREYVENLCGPQITQSWYQYENAWPADVIEIGKPRLISVVAVKYTDGGGNTAALDPSTYSVDLVDANHPRIVLNDGASWPSVELAEVNPIEIEFTCGYGAVADVPSSIKLAILLLVSTWYENRAPVFTGTGTPSELPFAVDALLTNYRWWGSS